MQQTLLCGKRTQSKVDVHVLHLPNEINAIGDLDDPHIVVHHTDGIEGNTLRARMNGFALGNEKYVSFVDPDDEVDVTAFQHCVDQLETDPTIGGVYTNSMVVDTQRDNPPYKMYQPHVWSFDRMKKPAPIHQLVVVRRDIMEQALIPFQHCSGQIAMAEQRIYAHIAVLAPWKFVDINAYTWYIRPEGGHAKRSYQQLLETRKYIANLIDSSRT